MVNGKPWNVEFDKIENVKDPGKLIASGDGRRRKRRA